MHDEELHALLRGAERVNPRIRECVSRISSGLEPRSLVQGMRGGGWMGLGAMLSISCPLGLVV
jgi:hypothetical protein